MGKQVLIVFLFFFLLSVETVLSQSTFTLNGYVKDLSNGEMLVGAVVSIPDKKTGAMTDENGFYTFSIQQDTFTIFCNYIGYKKASKKIFINKNTILNFELDPEDEELEEIIIKGNRAEDKIKEAQMSIVTITPKEARLIPVMFGEVDLIKTLQLKPGIQSGGEGTTGLYVRGGGPDQNLFLLDDATIYNPSHLFGLFSVFNTDAVKEIDLYKGDFPAEYGGRLSSVVDVKLNEGDKENYHATGGIGAIASRLTLEGPIQKNKSSFIISGRRTYFDVFTRAINRANKSNPNFEIIPDYHFYDLNGKVNFNIGTKDKISLSAYTGNDVFGYNQNNFDFDFNWGNLASTLKWTRILSSKLFSNVSLIYTDYKYNIQNQVGDFSFNLGSNIKNYALKTDFVYNAGEKHTIKFGGQATIHEFSIGRLRAGKDDGSIAFESGSELAASEFSIYVSDDIDLSPRLKLNNGIRLSGFYNNREFFKGLEPRLSFRYMITENSSFKASYARMYQYIHLATNSGAALPTDVWYPSGETVRPQRSDQIAAGVNKLFSNKKFLFSNEVYYKWMDKQIDFRDGAQIFSNPNLDQEFIFGKGWAYGNEIFLEKTEGKTTGWIGYTLSWTWRQFEAINNGDKFPSRYDRRHDASVVLIHRLTDRLSVSATWIYGTGNATSLPVGRMFFQNVPGTNPAIVPEYLERNSFRMPSYHRMDFGLVWKFKNKKGESDLTLSIYNVYNRRNAYFIYFEEVKDANNASVKFRAKKVSLFPIIPSLTYNFKF